MLLALPLAAQDTASDSAATATSESERPYRNPKRALLLGSLIPGAGHIYAGEYLKGFVNYEMTVMTIGAGTLVYIVGKCTFTFLSASKCDPGPEWPHRVAGVAIVGLGLWTWISSARDAPHAAERANARHSARSRKASPVIAPFSGPGNASQIGMSLSW